MLDGESNLTSRPSRAMASDEPLLFPQFANLPTELRLRIWSLAAPRRTIPVRLKQDLDAWNWASNLDWWMHYNVVPDGTSPSVIPAALLVNSESRGELLKQYRRPLQIDRDNVRTATRQRRSREQDQSEEQQQANKSFEKMCDASSVKPFNIDYDILEWAETWRWHRDAMTNTTPLFLGACLSVRHVSIEYAVWMNTHMETLAKAVINDSGSPFLKTITVTINQPRERRQAQYRLARKPDPMPPSCVEIKDSSLEGDDASVLRAAVTQYGIFVFDLDPWWLKESTAKEEREGRGYQSPYGGPFAVYQVLRPAELQEADKGLLARLDHVRHKSNAQFDHAHRTYTGFDPIPHNSANARLQGEVAAWCMKLNEQALDPFSRNLADDFTIPCHGICTPEYGLPGTAEEAWDSTCVRSTDWDKVWARRGAPAASSL